MSFKKKILLVDADESVRRNFCAFLEAEGYEVDFAENSQHALEKTTQAFYHLILLENTLPDIFGVDLIPKIKKQHPETAIIFITDFNTQEYAPQDFGTSPMITKPFNLEAIRYILQATLEKQHLILENYRLSQDLQYERENRIRAEEKLRKIQSELEIKISACTRQLTFANREFEQFVYSSYHGLRAPVRAIKLFAEVALRSNSLKAEIAEQFYAILGESERLFKLLDSMLIHGRLSKFAEKLEPVSILKVLQALMKKLHPQIEEFHAQLTLPTTDGYILGNATLLYQIFANLLDNALKYRHPGMQPKIDVHISQQASHIQIEVADNGIGIPAEYFEKVFQIFQRVHTSEEYPGVGIGLATVKKSVELMNGSVKISSVINEGTTFHLTFPKANVEIGF